MLRAKYNGIIRSINNKYYIYLKYGRLKLYIHLLCVLIKIY